MKLKLKSDGTRLGTYLIDQHTGLPIEGVSSIEYNVDGKKSELTVKLSNIPVEIETHAIVSVIDWNHDLEKMCESHLLLKKKNISSKGLDGDPNNILVRDAATGEIVSAVQSVCVKIDAENCLTSLSKIRFNHTAWI